MIRLKWNPPPVPTVSWHDVSVGMSYRNEAYPNLVVIAVAPSGVTSSIHACPITHVDGMTVGVGHQYVPVSGSRWIPVNLEITAEVCSV